MVPAGQGYSYEYSSHSGGGADAVAMKRLTKFGYNSGEIQEAFSPIGSLQKQYSSSIIQILLIFTIHFFIG